MGALKGFSVAACLAVEVALGELLLSRTRALLGGEGGFFSESEDDEDESDSSVAAALKSSLFGMYLLLDVLGEDEPLPLSPLPLRPRLGFLLNMLSESISFSDQ